MAEHVENERSPLVRANGDQRSSTLVLGDQNISFLRDSRFDVEDTKMADAAVGERLPYNDYTTIDQLHDLVSA